LSPLNSGTGNIRITLNFPDDEGISLVKVNGDISSEDFINIGNNTFTYDKNDITSGDYFINFELYRQELLRTTVSELVMVRNNLTSRKIITLAGENLKIIPTYEIVIDFSNLGEWELLEQNTSVLPNDDKAFALTEPYTLYQWYLDGILVGTSSSYIFNKSAGVYQLVVVVTNSSGESRSG